MMTVGQHDEWLGDALRSVPRIEYELRRQNGLSIVKELYEIGEIDKGAYAKFLFSELESCGYHYKKD